MIAPYKLVWLSQSTLDFDVWAEIAFDSEQGASSSFLNRESVSTVHYDGTYRRIHSYRYNEVFMPRITLVKNDYSDFTPEENRKILSWLTAKDTADWLEIYHDDSNVVSYRLYGNFVAVDQHKLSNGRVVGYECEFESSSPYAWSTKYEINKQVSKLEQFNVACNSDEYNKPLYPKVTVTFTGDDIYLPADKNPMDSAYAMIPNVIYSYEDNLYININTGDIEDQGKFQIVEVLASTTAASEYTIGGCYYFPSEQIVKKTVVIKNDGVAHYEWKPVSIVGAAVKINNTYVVNGETTSKETTIAGGAIGETIVFDGTNKVITSDKENTVKIVGDDFNWVWPSFVSGTNSLTITGNCDIKFEWIEPRKVGNV